MKQEMAESEVQESEPLNDDQLDAIEYFVPLDVNETTFISNSLITTDIFMKIFGFRMTSLTDEELREKYKGENNK